MDRLSVHAQANLAPSGWAVQALERLGVAGSSGRTALDLACGGGRHSRLMADHGYAVTAVDRQVPLQNLGDGIQFEQMDLESGPWPLQGRSYDLVLVSNYLFRPRLNELLQLLPMSGGCLIYETFMLGNEQFGSPRNPDFLLKPGELLSLCADMQILAFEQGLRNSPSQAVIQRIVAMKGDWHEIQSRSNLNSRRS